jgi:hypothetical protein
MRGRCRRALLVSLITVPLPLWQPQAQPYGDWCADAPGVVHHITPADIPPPA